MIDLLSKENVILFLLFFFISFMLTASHFSQDKGNWEVAVNTDCKQLY